MKSRGNRFSVYESANFTQRYRGHAKMEISIEGKSISNNVKNSSSRYVFGWFQNNRSTVRISMGRYFVRSNAALWRARRQIISQHLEASQQAREWPQRETLNCKPKRFIPRQLVPITVTYASPHSLFAREYRCRNALCSFSLVFSIKYNCRWY